MEDLLIDGLVIFGGAILTALTAVLGKFFQFLAGKVKIQKLSEIISRVDDLAIRVYSDVQQTYVNAIMEGKADGKLTQKEKDEAKERAIKALKLYLGPKGLGELKSLITGDAGLEGFLGSTIESIILREKKDAKKN